MNSFFPYHKDDKTINQLALIVSFLFCFISFILFLFNTAVAVKNMFSGDMGMFDNE